MTMPTPERAAPDPEAIKASYGFVGLLANQIPELGALLQQAVGQQWTPDRFVMQVTQTNWWRNTPEPLRKWTISLATDPATANNQMNAGAEMVRNRAHVLGAALPSWDDARSIWLSGKINDLDDTGMTAHIWKELEKFTFPRGGKGLGGRYGQVVNEMYQMAHEFGYQSNDLWGEIQGVAHEIMRQGGAGNTETFRTRMMEYAAAYYTPWAEQIRAGKTVMELSKPIRNRIGDLLELDESQVNLQDPLVKEAMTKWNPEGRAYSLREIEDMTRKDSRWQTTDNAFKAASEMLATIGKNMGMIGD